MHIYLGRCHCGNLQYRLQTAYSFDELPLRTCKCDYCLRQNGIYTSAPSAQLEYYIADEEQVGRYRFGHQTAEFMICRCCGIMPLILSTIEGTTYGIVNLCALGDQELAGRTHQRKDFEGEAVDDRLARRAKYWIPNVKVSPKPLS